MRGTGRHPWLRSLHGGRRRDKLALLDALDLDAYHVFHAVRADLLARLGRRDAALAAYERAAERVEGAEREFLATRAAGLRASS